MDVELIFVAKLLIMHYLFLGFPLAAGWLFKKGEKEVRISGLIIIAFLVAGFSWLLIGWEHWKVILTILLSHLGAAGWYAVFDKKLKHTFWVQSVQMIIILACWWFVFYKKTDLLYNWNAINDKADFWVIITALFFLTWPAAFIIGKLLEQWTPDISLTEGAKEKITAISRPIETAQGLSDTAIEQLKETIKSLEEAKGVITNAETSIKSLKRSIDEALRKVGAIAVPDKNESLRNAGKWIGIIERTILFALVIINQYEALGLLITAKSIIRFNDSDRQEKKTEYLLIGTLTSVSLAIITGIFVVKILHWKSLV